MVIQLHPSLLCSLENQHKGISELIKGCSNEALKNRPPSNKWSVHENIAHLTCYQPVFLSRLMLMQEKANPSFSRYSANDDSGFESYVNKSMKELITMLEADRNKIISFLKPLRSEQLSRTGVHPRFGVLNIVEWSEFFVLHEAHHLFTVFQLRHSV